MLRRVFILGMFVVVGARSGYANAPGDPKANIAMLRANVVQWYTRSAPSARTVERYIEALSEDGAWPDIDYADTDRGAWQPRQHLLRTLDMARAYAKAGHPLAGDAKLQAAVQAATRHWVREDYQNANWWFGRIGIPLLVSPTLVLMGDDLDPELHDKAMTQLLGRSKMGMTGQNKVWVAGIALMKGVLIEDQALIRTAKGAIFEELKITTKEGIQPDYSFHQHGPQQQWGNYGAGFGGDMLQWAGIFKGTDDALSGEQLDLLARYFIEGPAWILWKGRMDISGCGRQNFQGCQLGKGRSMLGQLELLNEVASPEPEAYRRIMASNAPEAPNTFIGNKHFWRSDMTVHRRPRWYASVKMSSTRVIGAETCNSENLLGLHLGDGVTYFHRTGAEYEDLLAVWDWRRLPGTTCRQDAGSLKPSSKRCRGQSDFVGGLSDGVRGLAAMEYLRDGLEARKAWFFLDDAVVCLGAGITSERPEPVVTSVDQCHVRTHVAVNRGRGTTLLGQGGRSEGHLSWVHHDRMGYVFLGANETTVGVMKQRGHWYDVHHRASKDMVERDVFNLWIDHGGRPNGATYGYAVVPDVTVEDMPALCASLPARVLQHSVSLLAVSSQGGKLIQAVFFEAGRLTYDGSRFIEVDTPCMVMLDRTKLTESLHLADPTHKLESIGVRLSGGYGATVGLPRNGLAGRSVAIEIQLQK